MSNFISWTLNISQYSGLHTVTFKVESENIQGKTLQVNRVTFLTNRNHHIPLLINQSTLRHIMYILYYKFPEMLCLNMRHHLIKKCPSIHLQQTKSEYKARLKYLLNFVDTLKVFFTEGILDNSLYHALHKKMELNKLYSIIEIKQKIGFEVEISVSVQEKKKKSF